MRGGGSLVELTFSPDVPGPLLSLGMVDRNRIYGEIGLNFFATVAAGAGYVTNPMGGEPRKTVHLFFGLPLPIVGVGPGGWITAYSRPLEVAPVYLYVDPFYRPEWTSTSSVQHGFGVLLKVRVGLTKRQWDRRPYGLFEGVFI
jgi:hypothetical protein